MPRDVPDDFIAEKNAQTNAPIWLYQVQVGDGVSTGEEDLFLAEYNEWVEFPTGSGTNWRPFPIRHQGIAENTEGSIDSLVVSISNVNREMETQLQNRDGLRGMKVTVRQVFADKLGNLSNAIEDVFYVDSVTSTEEEVTFNLTSKMDILRVEMPARRFSKGFCQWRYKREGCWPAPFIGGPGVPPGFTRDVDDCAKTLSECNRHTNVQRYGAFPSIPISRRFFL